MSSQNLRSILVHIIIPFATGAGLGAIFLCSTYSLDVGGGIRTLIATTGGSVVDLSGLSLIGVFGALAIGTNQAIALYGGSFTFVAAYAVFALMLLVMLAETIYAIARAW